MKRPPLARKQILVTKKQLSFLRRHSYATQVSECQLVRNAIDMLIAELTPATAAPSESQK